MIDALPATQRPRKRALLERVALHARTAPDAAQRLRRIGEAAERLQELGEVEKAKALFAEGTRLANQMTGNNEYNRAYFAAMLAAVERARGAGHRQGFPGKPPGRGIPGHPGSPYDGAGSGRGLVVLEGGAWHSECGPPRGLREAAHGRSVRAQRFFERSQMTNFRGFRADFFAYMALGLKARDDSASRRAIDEVLQAMDGLLLERPEQLYSAQTSLLPVIERIDSALVPEVFWRYVASRPTFANPRTIGVYSPSELIRHLARYDREVAAALFDSSRGRIDRTEDRELATWSSEFEAWASFDPCAAVTRLDEVPVGPDPSPNDARIRVASLLGYSYDQFLQTMWPD